MAALALGCVKKVEPKFDHIAKVKVLRDGSIYLNGAATTLEALDKALSELPKKQSAVWYYREDPANPKPPPQAEAVIQKIIEHRLPVKLYEKDFDKDPCLQLCLHLS